jgi:hypothetical protein
LNETYRRSPNVSDVALPQQPRVLRSKRNRSSYENEGPAFIGPSLAWTLYHALIVIFAVGS